MKKQKITEHVFLEKDEDAVHLEFQKEQAVLSSAVLCGGVVTAYHILNKRVRPKECHCEAPEHFLKQYARDRKWQGVCVGMMTAASMDSFRMKKESVDGVDVIVLLTAGLSNARRSGDRAEYRKILPSSSNLPCGTINIIALTSISLTPAAMVEACMMVTEAKTAALQDAGILSPVSGKIATGTGTDATAIVSSMGNEKIRYCGKHVLLGEILGRLTYEALLDSITSV